MIIQLRTFIFLVIVSCASLLTAQTYGPPVSWPIRLSGTFGELRPGHFHMGIDIKSPNGGVGHAIRSIEDGYISRVKVSAGGYGKVLYIIHPSGHESVYAHLQKFLPGLDKYVKDQQYAKQSYEIDINIYPGEYPVKKGQQIGEMGMTGRTFGPHLHFELRDKWTGEGLNPLNYGISVEDTEAPKFYQVVIYELDADNRIQRRRKIDPSKMPKVIQTRSDRIAVGIKSYDRMNGVRNLNGIHALSLTVDNQHIFGFDFDTLYHAQDRYINAHKDYLLYQTDDAYVNRMYTLPGNQLDIYQSNGQQGVINLTSGVTKELEVKVSDSFGNQRSLTFKVALDQVNPVPASKIFNHEILHDQPSVFHFDELYLSFPAGCVYQNTKTIITSRYDDALGQKVCRIHNDNEPVHQPYSLSLYLPEVADSLRSKYYIAGVNSKGDPANYGGKWKEDTLTTKLRSFGEFTVGIDNLPPTIKQRGGYKSKLKGDKQISFEIKDQTPRAQLSYTALLDGEWCLMEYDSKKDRLTHVFDWTRHQKGINGLHKLEVKVIDRNGNLATKTVQFSWEPENN